MAGATVALAAIALGPGKAVAQQISAGGEISFAVKSGGDAEGWGENGNHNAVSGVPSGISWASVSAGWLHACGVTTSGDGNCWGSQSSLQTTVPSGKTWVHMSAGSSHSCGVTEQAALVCWGGNQHGQVGPAPSGKQWLMISAGHFHSCGVTRAKEALCWGVSSGLYHHGQVTAVPLGETWSHISVSRAKKQPNANLESTACNSPRHESAFPPPQTKLHARARIGWLVSHLRGDDRRSWNLLGQE